MRGDAALVLDPPFGGRGGIGDPEPVARLDGWLKQFKHELLNVARRNPGRPQPDLDLGGVQVFGHGLFQRGYVDLEGFVFFGGQSGRGELGADIAGEVFVRGDIAWLVSRGFRQAVDRPLKLGRQLVPRLAGKLLHIRHVHTRLFRDGQGQRFACAVHMVHGLRGADGAPGEHIGLAPEVSVLVEDFQRAQQVVGGIVRKRLRVSPAVEQAVLCGVGVIAPVQLGLLVPNGAVRRGGVHLQGDELLHTVPQGHHALDAGFGGGAEVGPHHEAVFPVIHLPVHHGIGVVFYIRVGGNGGADGLARAQLRRLGFQVASLKALYGLMKLAGQVCAVQRQAGGFLAAAIHAVIPCHAAQNHFGMFCKVAVDGDAVPGLPQVDPIRLNGDGPVPLLQKKNVGGDFRVGVSGKGVVGKTDSAEQLGTLGDKAAHIGALLVHGSLGGHKGDDAAGPYLVDGFGEEVVVNVETKMIVGFVVDLIIPEGHVAHGQVEEIAPVGGFKPRHGDVRFRVELPGDAAGEAVQFHAVQAAARHALRQQAEEVAHTHSRFQNVPGAKAHLFHSVIDGADHRGAGVVGVEGGGAGRRILCLGQQRLELRVLLAPVLVLRVKRLRDAAPTHIAG